LGTDPEGVTNPSAGVALVGTNKNQTRGVKAFFAAKRLKRGG